MIDATLTLVSVTTAPDEYGVQRQTRTEREILCRVGSITRAEFAAAGRNGLNPQWVFTVAAVDYAGEINVVYDAHAYGIYRTYRVPGTDYMELYAEEKGGAHGGPEVPQNAG